jgi:hypothetical protein
LTAALLALMVALATPSAHVQPIVQCAQIENSGEAYPWESPPRIVLQPVVCAAFSRLARHYRPAENTWGLQILLHEAGHVAQGQEATDPFDLAVYKENDAECRSLAAMPAALTAMHYGRRFIRHTQAALAYNIATEGEPYGGMCPGNGGTFPGWPRYAYYGGPGPMGRPH